MRAGVSYNEKRNLMDFRGEQDEKTKDYLF